MISVRARVRNGRLIVDEPTDLPEGAVVELVADDADVAIGDAPGADDPLTADEQAELREIARGPFVAHADLRRKLSAQRR